jgi:hypothetical protein
MFNTQLMCRGLTVAAPPECRSLFSQNNSIAEIRKSLVPLNLEKNKLEQDIRDWAQAEARARNASLTTQYFYRNRLAEKIFAWPRSTRK